MALQDLLVNRVNIKLYGNPVNVNGRNVPSETIVSNVPCSVQESSGAARFGQDIEGSTSTGKTFFDHNPGVKYEDELEYGGRKLVCQAPATDEAGRGVLWTVRWQDVT